mgnify:CR=1 FL=1
MLKKLLDKKNILIIAFLLFIAIISEVLSIKTLGIKDGTTFTVSLLSTILILFIGKNNIKKAIYLFIISMPILVTARKGFYLDFVILKLNFESIIILYLFIIHYKEIKANIQSRIQNNKSVRYFLYLLFIFTLGALISSIFSKDIFETLRLTITSVLVPILLVLIIISKFDRRDKKALVYSFAISLNLSCLYGVMQILGIGFNISAIKEARESLTFGYHNGNIFVNIALMIFPLLLNELLYEKNKLIEKAFLMLSIMLQVISIFLTFSRGAWLGIAISCALILISKKYKYIFIAATILGLISLPYVLPKILGRGDTSLNFLQITSNTARVLSIITSKEVIKNNLLGVGFGNFNNYYRENVADAYLSINAEVRKYMVAPLYSMEHAHNFFLNIGVEIGVISLIAIILIFIDRIKECIKDYSFNRGIFISIILFVFIGLTTGIELNHKGVITNTYILWILFSMLSLPIKNSVEER